MAKRPEQENVASITIQSLSAAHRKTLQGLKPAVLAVSRTFEGVRERLNDIAPRVVKLFLAIQAEQERFTFVDFCRMFDATVPTHAADRDGHPGYRNHRTYYTLAYMRRLVQTGANRRRGQQGVRDSATDALARTLATVLQIVDEPESVWSAIQQEFGFSERLLTRLRKRVDETKPLVTLKATRPAHVGNVIHMEAKKAAAPDINAELSAPAAPTGKRRSAA